MAKPCFRITGGTSRDETLGSQSKMLGSETVPSRANPGLRCLHFPNLHCTAETLGRQISVFLVSCPCCHTRLFSQVDPPREAFLSFSFPLSGNQDPTFLHVPYSSGPCTPDPENFPDGRRALRRAVPEAGARGGGRVSRKPAGCPKRRKRRRITALHTANLI